VAATTGTIRHCLSPDPTPVPGEGRLVPYPESRMPTAGAIFGTMVRDGDCRKNRPLSAQLARASVVEEWLTTEALRRRVQVGSV
jgi:hypothetical protein